MDFFDFFGAMLAANLFTVMFLYGGYTWTKAENKGKDVPIGAYLCIIVPGLLVAATALSMS